MLESMHAAGLHGGFEVHSMALILHGASETRTRKGLVAVTKYRKVAC